MRSIIQSFIIAFSMYSKIPMPRDNWEEKNLRYAMCFFPFVGAVIGILVCFWYYLAGFFHIGEILRTAVLVVIPIIITGGIHMDGFLDTLDALSSNQTMEDRLRILSDPHAGAFAIIFCGVYYVLTFGFWYEIQDTAVMIAALGFVLSRSLSSLSVVSFKLAKNTGLAHIFSSTAVKKNVRAANVIMIVISAFGMVYINPVLGTITIAGAFSTFLYYRYKAYKYFGGITGDLCGYFLQLCELVMLICVVGGQLLWS